MDSHRVVIQLAEGGPSRIPQHQPLPDRLQLGHRPQRGVAHDAAHQAAGLIGDAGFPARPRDLGAIERGRALALRELEGPQILAACGAVTASPQGDAPLQQPEVRGVEIGGHQVDGGPAVGDRSLHHPGQVGDLEAQTDIQLHLLFEGIGARGHRFCLPVRYARQPGGRRPTPRRRSPGTAGKGRGVDPGIAWPPGPTHSWGLCLGLRPRHPKRHRGGRLWGAVVPGRRGHLR